MEERIRVAEDSKRFPNGVFTGDNIKVARGFGPQKQEIARICTREEWKKDRTSLWPPDRDDFENDGRLPYILTKEFSHYLCWRAIPSRITLMDKKIEESGQLLMF